MNKILGTFLKSACEFCALFLKVHNRMSRRNAETYASVRHQIEETLANDDFSKNLYQSTNGISRILDAIIRTKGEDWAAHVVDEQGKPMFTEAEQQQFTYVFQDHIYAILAFFDALRAHTQEAKETQQGGLDPFPSSISELAGLPDDFITTKQQQVTGTYGEEQDPTKMVGIDDIYTKIIDRIRSVDQTVNNYASKYGVLKLEKEYDLAPDVRLIPEPAALALSQGVMALGSLVGVPIPPSTTMSFLDKIKLPFRTIVFAVYMAMDIARISMAVSGRDTGRKVLSILVSLLDLLRGDWKKSILSFMGYFGMTPMLYGQIGKVFLTAFSMFSPQLQNTMILGSLDASKSFLIGLLLAIFQVTAPEEVRLPIIGALERVAQHKAKMDGVLESEGLSARPDYLAPTFEDLNNLQAVMSDPAYLCSCEFQTMVDAVNRSAPIKVALQLLRIPVTQEYKEYKCGTGPCEPFVTKMVETAQEEEQTQQKLQESLSDQNLQLPVSIPNTATGSRRGGRLIHARKQRLSA